MSLLGEISWDEIAPQGAPLPEGDYLVTVEAAQVKAAKKNPTTSSYAWRQYSNIRRLDGSTEFQLADGSTFRIGKRKLFKTSTLTNASEIAVRIGVGQIHKEAVAAGVVGKPEKGGKVTFPYDTPEKVNDYLTTVLVGRDVPVRVRQKVRADDQGNPVLNPDTQQPEIDVEVSDWLVK